MDKKPLGLLMNGKIGIVTVEEIKTMVFYGYFLARIMDA